MHVTLSTENFLRTSSSVFWHEKFIHFSHCQRLPIK